MARDSLGPTFPGGVNDETEAAALASFADAHEALDKVEVAIAAGDATATVLKSYATTFEKLVGLGVKLFDGADIKQTLLSVAATVSAAVTDDGTTDAEDDA